MTLWLNLDIGVKVKWAVAHASRRELYRPPIADRRPQRRGVAEDAGLLTSAPLLEPWRVGVPLAAMTATVSVQKECGYAAPSEFRSAVAWLTASM